jgi:hypothetical protein
MEVFFMLELKPMLVATETLFCKSTFDNTAAVVAIAAIDSMLKEENDAEKIKQWDEIHRYIRERDVGLHTSIWRKVLNDQVLYEVLKKQIPTKLIHGILTNYGI